MRGLVQLLTSQHSTPLSALAMALPCPALPADLQQVEQEADGRVQHQQPAPHGGSHQQQPFTSRRTASLTPGIPSSQDASKFVEAVVLRGARSEARVPMQLSASAARLDGALLEEQARCVRHRTLTALPLPMPLPFPHLFTAGVSACGDVLPAAERPASSGGADVASCPVLTRQSGTAAFAPLLRGLAQQFRGTAGSAQGQSILEGWGIARDEHSELEERLEVLAQAYEEGD